MSAVIEEEQRAAGAEASGAPLEPLRVASRNVRRFRRMALAAVLAASVPYLWVLWDLFTGSVDPFRIDGSDAVPGSVIYDTQARALLHGHLSLPTGSIGFEAFVHHGRTYTYFGILPSLIRIPILIFTHSLDGHLSALSLLAAWIVTALFVTLLIWRLRIAVRGDARLGWPEAASYGLLIFSVLAGSVLVSLASTPNAYTEDEGWAVALACGSLFALLGMVERPSWGRLTAAGALVLATNLNRGTSGYACILATVLIAAWFGLGRAGPERKRWAIPLLIAGLVATAVGCAIDFAKFQLLFGYPGSEQVLYKVFGFAHINGGKHFSLHFLPSTLLSYLSPLGLRPTSVFPYLAVPSLPPTHVIAHTELFNVGNTASAPASMPLLFGLALWGIFSSFGARRQLIVRSLRLLMLASAATAASLLIYGSIYERFLGDFMPLLVLAGAAGMVDIWRRLDGTRYAIRIPGISSRLPVPAVRLAVSGIVLLALFGFVANMGIAVTPQASWTQTQAAGYVRVQNALSDVTGHPLGGIVARADTLPNKAPMGQLLIKGHCDALYLSLSDGTIDPWLRVERKTQAPLCDSLYARATNLTLGTAIVTPRNHQAVSGPHVLISASTFGEGTISGVTFYLIRQSPFSVTTERGRRTHGRWSYTWDTSSVRNGPYSLYSQVTNTAGYATSSAPVTVTVSNPGNGS